MSGRIDQILAVCGLTFTEAVRQKFFYIVVLICVCYRAKVSQSHT